MCEGLGVEFRGWGAHHMGHAHGNQAHVRCMREHEMENHENDTGKQWGRLLSSETHCIEYIYSSKLKGIFLYYSVDYDSGVGMSWG